jgi:hypothetical protein
VHLDPVTDRKVKEINHLDERHPAGYYRIARREASAGRTDN